MKRVVAAAIAVLVSACSGGHTAAPDGRDFPHVVQAIDRNAPSMAELAWLTYSGTDAGTVTLDSGQWRGNASGASGATELRLVPDFRLTGDITGNGSDEAVVLLRFSGPPFAERTYVAVAGSSDGHLTNIATAPVSARVQVQGGRLERNRILLEGFRAEGNGVAAASRAPVRLIYQLDGDRLHLIDETP